LVYPKAYGECKGTLVLVEIDPLAAKGTMESGTGRNYVSLYPFLYRCTHLID
jgi:hypothetical protein